MFLRLTAVLLVCAVFNVALAANVESVQRKSHHGYTNKGYGSRYSEGYGSRPGYDDSYHLYDAPHGEHYYAPPSGGYHNPAPHGNYHYGQPSPYGEYPPAGYGSGYPSHPYNSGPCMPDTLTEGTPDEESIPNNGSTPVASANAVCPSDAPYLVTVSCSIDCADEADIAKTALVGFSAVPGDGDTSATCSAVASADACTVTAVPWCCVPTQPTPTGGDRKRIPSLQELRAQLRAKRAAQKPAA